MIPAGAAWILLLASQEQEKAGAMRSNGSQAVWQSVPPVQQMRSSCANSHRPRAWGRVCLLPLVTARLEESLLLRDLQESASDDSPGSSHSSAQSQEIGAGLPDWLVAAMLPYRRFRAIQQVWPARPFACPMLKPLQHCIETLQFCCSTASNVSPKLNLESMASRCNESGVICRLVRLWTCTTECKSLPS